MYDIFRLPLLSETYSDISDHDLDRLVRNVQQQHPGVGIRLLKGHLKSLGHRIQRDRIQLSLLRTDPTGVLQRWKQSVKRRIYNVYAPQSLWHIDGNHKLIRYQVFALDNKYYRFPFFNHMGLLKASLFFLLKVENCSTWKY